MLCLLLIFVKNSSGAGYMDEQRMIDWSLQAKKLLRLLEKRQALPANHPRAMAELEKEIASVEELISSYRRFFVNERDLSSCDDRAPRTLSRRDGEAVSLLH
jgi:hypothetical protein